MNSFNKEEIFIAPELSQEVKQIWSESLWKFIKSADKNSYERLKDLAELVIVEEECHE